MKKTCIALTAFFSCTPFLVGQQIQLDSLQHINEVYIAAKAPLNRKNSGKTVTVISKEMIEQNAGKTVAQVLNEVAGFEMNGSNSNNGQNLGYFVRGGRNRQVLFIVDGVPINDPSQIANDFDLRLLSLASIEKIEVMKGASSVLYGSGAAAAVVSITTKKAVNKPFSIQTETVIATDRAAEDKNYPVESLNNQFNLSGTAGKFFYQANIAHQYSDGLSAIAAPEEEAPFSEDTFSNFNSNLTLGYKINEKITLSRFLAVDQLSADFDDFSYLDAENNSATQQLRTGGNFQWRYKKGTFIWNDIFTQLEREITSAFPSKFDSYAFHFDTYLQHHFSENLTVVVGLNGNLSEMNSFTIPFGEEAFMLQVTDKAASISYFDPYINTVFKTNFGLTFNAGARLNIHNLYGSNLVYQINPSFFKELGSYGVKILGSYSTAYITPSLFQLYDPLFGNEVLQPEQNTTIEAGFEVSKGNLFRLSAIYFQRDEDNFVDFVTIDPVNFISQYQNIADSFLASGIELELYTSITKNLSFQANYTNTQADERFALRIPEHSAFGQLNFNLDEKTQFGTAFQYIYERNDQFFNQETFETETVLLDAYSLVNFTASRKLSKIIRVFLGIDNLLNTEFEELFRFQARGRNIRLGFHLNL